MSVDFMQTTCNSSIVKAKPRKAKTSPPAEGEESSPASYYTAGSLQKDKTEQTEDGCIDLPSAVELATLAANLRPNAAPSVAIKVAMEFWVEATLSLKELPNDLDELQKSYGSSERNPKPVLTAVGLLLNGDWSDTLELDSRLGNDGVRAFFARSNINWKSARAVLDNVRLYINLNGIHLPGIPGVNMDGQGILDGCLRSGTSHKIYDIPKFILQRVASSTKDRRKESKMKHWKKRQIKKSV